MSFSISTIDAFPYIQALTDTLDLDVLTWRDDSGLRHTVRPNDDLFYDHPLCDAWSNLNYAAQDYIIKSAVDYIEDVRCASIEAERELLYR